MKAYLLAAGLGTRLGEITRETPKCLLPVAGQPLLSRWFDQLAAAGVGSVLVNTHHLADQVEAHVVAASPPLEVVLAHEPRLLGSGGTLAAHRDFAAGEERFLVVYADNASSVDLAAFAAAAQPGWAATLGLFRVSDPRSCGVVEIDGRGRVLGFAEKPERPRSDLAWAGLLVGSPELLEALPEQPSFDLGRDVLPGLVGRMRGVEIHGYHRDIGTPESYRQACADLEPRSAADAEA